MVLEAKMMEFCSALISDFHEKSQTEGPDDIDYIGILKVIINRAGRELKDSSLLYDFARDMFVTRCVENNRDSYENEKKYAKESGKYFDYIYEHEDYPKN